MKEEKVKVKTEPSSPVKSPVLDKSLSRSPSKSPSKRDSSPTKRDSFPTKQVKEEDMSDDEVPLVCLLTHIIYKLHMNVSY